MVENNSVIWAAQNGDCEFLEVFLNQVLIFWTNITKFQGNSIDTPIQGNRTILHVASDFGRKEVIELAITKGANINVLISLSIV